MHRERLSGAARACALAVALTLAAGAASAITIDFEGLGHGEVAGTIGIASVTPSNPNRPFDLAVGFDSNLGTADPMGGTADPDLERGAGWAGGNAATDDLGILLILQEDDAGCDTGTCSDPNDEGARPAGELVLDFSVAVLDFGFTAVDLESVAKEDLTLTFAGDGMTAEVGLEDYLDPLSPFYDPTIALGNNTANRFAPIAATQLGLSRIERVTIALGGSTGIDEVVVTPVPEPSTVLLIALGVGGLALPRTRRR